MTLDTVTGVELDKLNGGARPVGMTDAELRQRLQRVDKLERALQGIASCATQCPCCEMHRLISEKALGYEVEIVTDKLDI